MLGLTPLLYVLDPSVDPTLNCPLNLGHFRTTGMQRRHLLGMLAIGVSALGPLTSIAQQKAIPVIGFVSSLAASDAPSVTAAFRQGLSETGYVEGRNVAIEYRWAASHYDRLPALVADLIRREVTVIAAISGTPTVLAAKAATATIPIVFAIGGDPIAPGLVTSLNRPGGNITGVTFFTAQLAQKRLELLHELVAKRSVIAVMANLKNPPSALEAKNAQTAARVLGLQVKILNVATEGQIDDAFAEIVRQGMGSLFVSADPLFFIQQDKLVALAARYGVPTSYPDYEQAQAGGLMSYGASRPDAYREAARYVGRILNGEKPGDLPVQQPTKFEFVINLKTAKALGLTVPPSLLARADEVIE
jgi:putative ABC transport system substrate-binding protein